MKNKVLFVVLTSLTASGVRSEASQIGVDMSDWNIITSGNLQDVTDFNGNAYVGGNVTAGNSFDVATSDNGGMPAGNYSLAVAGNINSGGNINVDHGNVVVGGTTSGRTININGGGTLTQGNPSAVPSSPFAQVASASQYWSGLAANSTAAIANNQISFNCAANSSVAVFNVTASQLFAQNQNLILNPSASTAQILINVSGTSATEAGGQNFSGNFQNWANRVVLNFYQATTVAFDSSVDGYVVAPDATVSGNAPIVGGVAAASLNNNSEVELPSSAANYLSAPDLSDPGVPDGGTTASLLGLAFTGIAIIRRQLRKA
jgi:choice-of-anchor A domain-containing protein